MHPGPVRIAVTSTRSPIDFVTAALAAFLPNRTGEAMPREYLCERSDLAEAVPKMVRKSGRLLAVVNIEDDVFVVDAVCPHWKGPLGMGSVSARRREIVCPWHRFRYSLED